MNKGGPIIVIDDDKQDQEILQIVFKDLDCPNEIIFFSDGQEALDFLSNTDKQPFLMLSDINMPKLNGFDIKKEISAQPNVNLKCIPYLFLTTGTRKQDVVEAYALRAQGFFVKPTRYDDLKNILRSIIAYWSQCIAPADMIL